MTRATNGCLFCAHLKIESQLLPLFFISIFHTERAYTMCKPNRVTVVRHVRMVFGSDVAMSIFTTFDSIIIIYS